MTDVATASTGKLNAAAGVDLAEQLLTGLGGHPPDAVLVFASSQNDYEALLTALSDGCSPGALVGCSSAGEFTTNSDGTGRSSAIALRAADMRFTAAAAANLSNDRAHAAREIVNGFRGLESVEYRYRTALVFVDALAGYADDVVDQLTQATGGMYQFAGGGAGDDGNFHQTHIFHGTKALTNAVVALEILSHKPIGIGARHGWSASGNALRVTESADACVISFNASPAVEAFSEHAQSTGQTLQEDNPLPFFLHNIVGVRTSEGHKLRVPLAIAENGGVVCASELPTGATADIMWTKPHNAADAAASAARDAMQQVRDGGSTPAAALFLDCVATRLRLGHAFDEELDAVRAALEATPFAGFNSYGQIVRATGQFNGFHNCTAVVVVFPA